MWFCNSLGLISSHGGTSCNDLFYTFKSHHATQP
uniref:Uncharacterized protein n=1 Tax=Anguilla anguilla TaxID=7936 RepID=A0A0E9UR87_ANGAN